MGTDSERVALLSEGGSSGDTNVYELDETNDGTIVTVTHRDRQLLEQLATQNHIELDPVDADHVQVTSTGYAGVIALPDGAPIHIRPKLTGTPLLRLLQYSETTDPTTIEREADIAAGTDYVDLLGTLFADELEAVRRQGISQSYVTTSDSEDYIRGRLDMQRQLQRNGPAAPEFECTYDELTRDTTLNQTILFATQTLVGAVSEPTLKRRLRRHVQELRRSVTLRPVSFETADSIHLSRLDDHYADLLRLAKLVLRNVYIQDIAPGRSAGYTILLRMYDQFESAVENAVAAAAPEYTVQTGETAALDGFLTGDFALTPKPDVVITDDTDTPLLVLDAKWKTPESQKGTASPGRGDIYQVLSYQQHTDTPGVLVYPGADGGIQGKATTAGGRAVWLATLPVETEQPTRSYAAYADRMDTALTSLTERTIDVE